MKLCKDCHFVERSFWGKVESFAECHHPAATETPKPDPVLGGERTPRPNYASTMRLKDMPCGPDAKLFHCRSDR